jgi:hypothetical protein
MPPQQLLHLAAEKLDWEELPECISYRLYEHAKDLHRIALAPSLRSIRGRTFGRKVLCSIARTGDLIHKAFLQIDLPPLPTNAGQPVAWTRNIGHVILDEMNVGVGGTRW